MSDDEQKRRIAQVEAALAARSVMLIVRRQRDSHLLYLCQPGAGLRELGPLSADVAEELIRCGYADLVVD